MLRCDKKVDSFERRLEKDILQDHITALYAPRIIAEVFPFLQITFLQLNYRDFLMTMKTPCPGQDTILRSLSSSLSLSCVPRSALRCGARRWGGHITTTTNTRSGNKFDLSKKRDKIIPNDFSRLVKTPTSEIRLRSDRRERTRWRSTFLLTRCDIKMYP